DTESLAIIQRAPLLHDLQRGRQGGLQGPCRREILGGDAWTLDIRGSIIRERGGLESPIRGDKEIAKASHPPSLRRLRVEPRHALRAWAARAARAPRSTEGSPTSGRVYGSPQSGT